MRKQLRSVSRRIVGIIVAWVVALSIPAEALADCRVVVDLYNDQRRVPGEVNAECFGPHSWDQGYGNWGVVSNYGGVQDTDQFAGWKPKGRQRHWQSCTGERPRPNCWHYNDRACTAQKAHPDNARKYASHTYAPGGLCNAIGVFTINNVFMHILELDWPDGDDPVASLLYGDIDVPLTCSNASSCRGQSSWIPATSGGGTVSARVRIVIRTYLWMSPTGH